MKCLAVLCRGGAALRHESAMAKRKRRKGRAHDFPRSRQTKPNRKTNSIMADTAELEAEITRLRARLQTQKQPARLTLKVSEKGGASLYGIGRFPLTLYKEQWARVLDHAEPIRAFLAENDHALKAKD